MINDIIEYNLNIPILNKKIGLSNQELDEYIKLSYEISVKEDFKRTKLTNLTGYRSDYKLHLKSSKFHKILDLICEEIKNSIPFEFFYPKTAFKEDQENFLRLQDSWCGVYVKDSVAKYHSHTSADVSFCYYLQVDEHSSPIIFDQLNFEIKPKKTHLVAFPGFLGHRVPLQSKHTLDRVIIAGNFLYV